MPKTLASSKKSKKAKISEIKAAPAPMGPGKAGGLGAVLICEILDFLVFFRTGYSFWHGSS